MIPMRLRIALAALALLALSACGTVPTHPAVAQAEQAGRLPPLIPMRRFVAHIDFMAGFTLSPDGRHLLWNETVGTDSGLAVRPVAGGDKRSFATGFLANRTGMLYTWLPDSRHVLYVKDLSGDENLQLHVFDAQQPFSPWNATPWPGVRSTFVANGEPGSARFFFASNRRDRASMDLYEADAAARSVREIARNDGRVLNWVVGVDHQLAGRKRQLGEQDGSDVAFEVLRADGTWHTVSTAKAFEEQWVHRIDRAGKAWGLSNLGRDKRALVEIDLASGRETVLGQHPQVDLDTAIYPPRQGAPMGYTAEPGLPAAHYLDARWGADLQAAAAKARTLGLLDADPWLVRPQSMADDGRRLVVRTLHDFDVAELLVDRDTGDVQRLDPKEPERRLLLSPEQPYSFKASDGLAIHGYVTRPRGVQGPAPLVVVIHGGPWARDHWQSAGYNGTQMLANRGYAVLTVNYRGSLGYGRAFMKAGFGEYFGRMQKDVAEAAQWAIDQGIADARRMAVFGGSFGGFSVLAQLIHKHHDWRCGIDVVGVANWPRVIESWPPFWRNRHYFEATFGDVRKPEERARMLANSPVSHLDKITVPLLVVHGANDIRVLREDSDEVVRGLRQLGRPVEYLSFPNEGHSVRRWRNRLELWRRVEDTLAGCLGGRSAGWDYYELMPREAGG